MSDGDTRRSLPAELLDCIVDFLRYLEAPLQNCSLVSKSWVPRARKHLFAEVRFRDKGSLQLWKAAFADSSTSPSKVYTKTLVIGFLVEVAVTGGDLIPAFSHIVHLALESHEAPPGKLAIFFI